jgi:SprT protein
MVMLDCVQIRARSLPLDIPVCDLHNRQLMSAIAPINHEQQIHVITETARYITLASDLLQRPFDEIPVLFNLKGLAAGMYRVNRQGRCIRYNPYLFAKYFDENFATTIPHEVAHYIVDQVYGLHRAKPHGVEWRELMQMFGADASRTALFDVEGIPSRVYRRYAYQCNCNTYELTSRRHNRITHEHARYHCRRCGTILQKAKDLT